MPTLYILSGPQIGNTFELSDQSVLGRAPTCDRELAVPLRDSSVSRNHARIEREGDSWYIADLGSSNGMHFDGLRVKRQELVGQVDFKLGELELRVRVEAAKAPAPAPAKPVAPAPAPKAEPVFDEMEIELEEEIDLGDEPYVPPPKPAPKPTPAPAPVRPALTKTRLSTSAPADEPVMKRKVLQYNRVENRSGLFSTEMSQWPPLVQFVMVIFALAVVAGLGYGAFLATQSMRG